MDNLEQLRFPIGKFHTPQAPSQKEINEWIVTISEFPKKVNSIAASLNIDQLLTPYRKEGWNGIQVIHHCADSHMNAYIRFKLGLTEDSPEIRPYFENKWAELKDGNSTDQKSSLSILEGLHQRWTVMLPDMTPEESERLIVHPEYGSKDTLAQLLAMYAWHCNHHFAHLELIQKNFE